jgi:ADP-ribosylglycohydrolase
LRISIRETHLLANRKKQGFQRSPKAITFGIPDLKIYKWHCMTSRKSFLEKTFLSFVAAGLSPILSAQANTKKKAALTAANTLLQQKIEEAVYAFVVADAMGGSIENFLPEEVFAKYGDWDFTRFLPPTSKKDIESGKGKGNGRTTDDSINFEALINIYNQHLDHLDAYSYADLLIKEHNRKIFIAERGEQMKPVDRPLWWPERYVYQRLAINNIEPRYAGMGNYINEGFQGIVLPVGAVNAGDPWRAYNECVGIGMAHTESFGIEAAAVNAAAYAVAFKKNSTIKEVIKTTVAVAKDGSGLALKDVLAVTNSNDDLQTFIDKTRKAVVPYLQLSPTNERKENIVTPKLAHEQSNIARASRIAVVENFPIALACLQYGNGDYMKTLKASLFYGRDGETIAAVSTSLLAAIKGEPIIPAKLKQEVDEVNKRNYAAIAKGLFESAKVIFEKDKAVLQQKELLLG